MTSPDRRPFQPISGGGSLLLAWQLKHRQVLIIGGGNIAADRIRSVLTADAIVTLICPNGGLGEEVKFRLADRSLGIIHIDRNFDAETDLDGPNGTPHMVLVAIDDPTVSKEIWQSCKARRINVNVADVPTECDFYFGSTIKRGPLQVMVSTGGKGPRLANRIRRKIEATLSPNIGDAINNIGRLRSELRIRAPGHAAGPRRMSWMIRVSDKWDLDDLATMTDLQREAVLDGWETDVAKGPSDVPGARTSFLSWIRARLQGSAQVRACPLTPIERASMSALGGFALGAAVTAVVYARIWR